MHYISEKGILQYVFSREGLRPRVLFVRSGFSPPPGVGLQGGGGLECRKNTVLLKRRLKNTCVFALRLLLGVLWESMFYAYLWCSRLIDSQSVSIGSA